jgi:transposase-like protein
MATTTRRKGDTGKRYTEAERKRILDFIAKRGRGGISAATREFGVSYIALRRWMQNGPAGKLGKAGKASAGKIKAGLDGRKARRIRTALATVKALRGDLGKLQTALKQLLK